eukprot:gene3447-4827_t
MCEHPQWLQTMIDREKIEHPSILSDREQEEGARAMAKLFGI